MDIEQGAIILVVLLSIFTVPVMITMVFKHFGRKRELELQARMREARAAGAGGPLYYRVVIRTPHLFGMLDKCLSIFNRLGHEVLDFRMEYEPECTVLEGYVLDGRFATLMSPDQRAERVDGLRAALVEAVGSHDPETAQGAVKIKAAMEKAALEAGGGLPPVLRVEEMDDLFDEAGRGILVGIWTPWMDAGFLLRATYHQQMARAGVLQRRVEHVMAHLMLGSRFRAGHAGL